MTDSRIRDTNTLEIVKAATRIVSAMAAGGGVQAERTYRSTARSIDAAIATGLPLDDAFVARTVWNMTRGTHSRAYESVMPEHGPLISRAAAFQTSPDDLRALVADGWSSGAEEIPTYSRVVDGAEWLTTQASGRWDVTRPEGGMRRLMLRENTAHEAIKSMARMISADPGERAARDATSAISPNRPAAVAAGVAVQVASHQGFNR